MVQKEKPAPAPTLYEMRNPALPSHEAQKSYGVRPEQQSSELQMNLHGRDRLHESKMELVRQSCS